MPDLYALTAADIAVLKGVIEAQKHRRASTSNRGLTPHADDSGNNSPEMYLIRAGATGIPSMSGSIPGSAVCEMYSVVGEGESVTLAKVEGLTRRVFNVTDQEVLPYAWCLTTRDKFGAWFVIAPSQEQDTGTGTDSLVPSTIIGGSWTEYQTTCIGSVLQIRSRTITIGIFGDVTVGEWSAGVELDCLSPYSPPTGSCGIVYDAIAGHYRLDLDDVLHESVPMIWSDELCKLMFLSGCGLTIDELGNLIVDVNQLAGTSLAVEEDPGNPGCYRLCADLYPVRSESYYADRIVGFGVVGSQLRISIKRRLITNVWNVADELIDAIIGAEVDTYEQTTRCDIDYGCDTGTGFGTGTGAACNCLYYSVDGAVLTYDGGDIWSGGSYILSGPEATGVPSYWTLYYTDGDYTREVVGEWDGCGEATFFHVDHSPLVVTCVEECTYGTVTFDEVGESSWTALCSTATVEVWAPGGAGKSSGANRGGGGGGAYSRRTISGLTVGLPYVVYNGAPGLWAGTANGEDSYFNDPIGAPGASVLAAAGKGGANGAGGAGGLVADCIGDDIFAGGSGDLGNATEGGGGGGSAGPADDGNDAAGSGGAFAVGDGGAGGNGATLASNGTAGGNPGGGGGGGLDAFEPGDGAAGKIVITWGTPP